MPLSARRREGGVARRGHHDADPHGGRLRGRNLLKDSDLTQEDLRYLLELAAQLKAGKRARLERPRLGGRAIALIFEKPSTRTRCAFEVAAYDQGAHVTYLDSMNSHIGERESIKDSARVLGRLYDGILYRGHRQAAVEILGDHAGAPVWNGLTDLWHPTQALCDLLTMREHSSKPWPGISVAYLGDGRSNVANSLRIAGATIGMDVRIVSPGSLRASESVIETAEKICAGSGARVTDTDDVELGVRDADFVYTDVWVRIGEAAEQWRDRVNLLRDYRVDRTLLARTGNPEVKFLHCLPALHDGASRVGARVCAETGLESAEVSDEVFESAASLVFEQAENRLHTIKAVLVATLA
jgi:ornithine carbamoyltransferase